MYNTLADFHINVQGELYNQTKNFKFVKKKNTMYPWVGPSHYLGEPASG